MGIVNQAGSLIKVGINPAQNSGGIDPLIWHSDGFVKKNYAHFSEN